MGVASRRDAVAAEIPKLRRYARALLGDDGEADDLIQDTLERALARLEQWRDGDNPRKWLFSILHNLHVDGLRRKSRRPPHVGLDNVGVEHSAPAADGASGRDLDQALQLLSGEQRRVVLLVGLEGLSYAETARGAGDSRRHGHVAAGARARPVALADGLRRRQERPCRAAEGEMTAPRRISEAELHALVDGELTGEERAEVEALLAGAPAEQALARDFRDLNQAMRARYAGRLEEPVPQADAGGAGAHAATAVGGGACGGGRSLPPC